MHSFIGKYFATESIQCVWELTDTLTYHSSYGISQLRSPQRHPANKAETSFTALQDRAKQYFNDTNTSDVSQLLEDFCRECDKHVEEEKEKMKDLQEQVRDLNAHHIVHSLTHAILIA